MGKEGHKNLHLNVSYVASSKTGQIYVCIFRKLHTCIKIEYNKFKIQKDIHFFKSFSKKYFHLLMIKMAQRGTYPSSAKFCLILCLIFLAYQWEVPLLLFAWGNWAYVHVLNNSTDTTDLKLTREEFSDLPNGNWWEISSLIVNWGLSFPMWCRNREMDQ